MLTLYVPKLEDYWYEQKLQSDPKTMKYNAGYDVSYYGYHYDTGCIDFPKEGNYLMIEELKKKDTLHILKIYLQMNLLVM